MRKVPYHTKPNAPIPTGCKSVYLLSRQLGRVVERRRCLPAGDLEGGAKDLGTHELRHLG